MAALRARHPDARWLPPHKLHMTLVFLGQTESRDVQRKRGNESEQLEVARR